LAAIAAALAAMAAASVGSSAPARAEDVAPECKDKLGVARVVEIDTAGGKVFGDQYPPSGLLQKGEVVLTFDDGPHPTFTKQILDALKAQCTKATFFEVGEMVKEYPDASRAVQADGHTVGTHTWSHPNLGAMSLEGAKRQIERTIAITNTTLPKGVAPFFRFPYLSDPKRVREYLATRNIAVFGVDVDSLDYRMRKPEKVVDNVMKGLDKLGSGIILFHDIHEVTAKAIPTVLEELRKKGYKVVQLVPKSPVEVVAVADTEPEKDAKDAKPKGRSRHVYHHRRRRYANQ
jgi:peptidoglycan/xylan/chitin deacetylase (PgdA/CDA1 family)